MAVSGSKNGKSILVKGAAGFIGTNFVLEWLGLDNAGWVERFMCGAYRISLQKNYSNR